MEVSPQSDVAVSTYNEEARSNARSNGRTDLINGANAKNGAKISTWSYSEVKNEVFTNAEGYKDFHKVDWGRGSKASFQEGQNSWVAQEAERQEKRRSGISRYRKCLAKSQALHLSSSMVLVAILAWLRLFPALSHKTGLTVTMIVLDDPKVALIILRIAEDLCREEKKFQKKGERFWSNDTNEIWTAFGNLFLETYFDPDVVHGTSLAPSLFFPRETKLLSMFLSYAVSDQCRQQGSCVEMILSLPKNIQQYLFNIIENCRQHSSALGFKKYDAVILSIENHRDEGSSSRQDDSCRDEASNSGSRSSEIISFRYKVGNEKIRQLLKDEGTFSHNENLPDDRSRKHRTHEETLALQYKGIDQNLLQLEQENRALLFAAKQQNFVLDDDRREENSSHRNFKTVDRERTWKEEDDEYLHRCMDLEEKNIALKDYNQKLEDDLEATTSNLEVTTKVLGYMRTKFSCRVNEMIMKDDNLKIASHSILDDEAQIMAGAKSSQNSFMTTQLEAMGKDLKAAKEELEINRQSEQKLQNRLQEMAEAVDRVHAELVQERKLLTETKAELAWTSKALDRSLICEARLKKDFREITEGKDKLQKQFEEEQKLVEENKSKFEVKTRELNQQWLERMSQVRIQMKEERKESFEVGKKFLKESVDKSQEIIRRLEGELQKYKESQKDNSDQETVDAKSRYKAQLNVTNNTHDTRPWNSSFIETRDDPQ